MILRQKLQALLLLLLIFFAFASYHKNTGDTTWLQWLTVVVFLSFTFIFDVSFSGDSQFIFDPDAENWRRKTVSHFRSGSSSACGRTNTSPPFPTAIVSMREATRAYQSIQAV